MTSFQIIIVFLTTFLSFTWQLENTDYTPVPSDIFLDIDGISLAPSVIHACVLVPHEQYVAGK